MYLGGSICSCIVYWLMLAVLHVSAHKTGGPSMIVTFLVDTVLFQMRLPPEKVTQFQAMVEEWSMRHWCTCRELKSFIGYLAHAATSYVIG